MYLFNMLDMSECLSCLISRSSIINSLIFKNHLVCLLHVIIFSSTYFIIFVSFLSFLFSRSFIMLKYYLDYFYLTQFILAEDIQMLFLCKCCAKQKKFCVVSDKLNKCSKCIYLKKSCLFSF